MLDSRRGVVISCGMNPCYGDLDTYWMAASAIDEPNEVNNARRGELIQVRTPAPDLTAADLDAAVRTIAGSARSMGLNVEGVE